MYRHGVETTSFPEWNLNKKDILFWYPLTPHIPVPQDCFKWMWDMLREQKKWVQKKLMLDLQGVAQPLVSLAMDFLHANLLNLIPEHP